jgi:S1-C subfamily serine protease
MQRTLTRAESTSAELKAQLQSSDTTLAKALQRQFDSLRAKAQEAASSGNQQENAAMQAAIEQHRVRQEGLVQMDLTAIAARNTPAVAFLVTELDGDAKGGTAFGVTKSGLMVTNRHNVKSDATGRLTTQLQVAFSGTSTYLPATVGMIADDADVALIQIQAPGDYPVVSGINGAGTVPVGGALAMIGFPLSLELPMAGNTVSATLSPGTASRRIPTLLQVDAFGAHGMSGSPVFDSHGLVVGVVYGGPKGAPQIIYAVPSDRVAALIGEAGKGIVR